MKLNIRQLIDDDWQTLENWWKKWPDWNPPPKDFLPEDGKGGYMIYKDNKPIVAGFVYLTNSKTAILEWIVSDPDYRESDRDDAIVYLIRTLELFIKDWGYKYIFSVGRTKKLIEKHKDLGYHVDDKPVYEIVKKIN